MLASPLDDFGLYGEAVYLEQLHAHAVHAVDAPVVVYNGRFKHVFNA